MTNKILRIYQSIRKNYQEKREEKEDKKIMDRFVTNVGNNYLPKIRNDTWADSDNQLFMN